MSVVQSTMDAIKMAMDAEKEAHSYYSQAAERATNPKGKDMFKQLAAFELNHYTYLKSLLESLLEGNGWTVYGGTHFSERAQGPEAKKSPGSEGTSDDVLSILSKAIDDEKKASAYYSQLSQKTDDPSGKDMFTKLAEEEKLHTKILSEQWHSLSNHGIWVWGD